MVFVASDKTDYHTDHVKRTLKFMEKEDTIKVDESTRRRKYTYPKGTRISFI